MDDGFRCGIFCQCFVSVKLSLVGTGKGFVRFSRVCYGLLEFGRVLQGLLSFSRGLVGFCIVCLGFFKG